MNCAWIKREDESELFIFCWNVFFVFWFVRKRVSYKVVAFRIILFSEWFEKSETTHSPYKWMLNQPEVFWIFVTKCLEKCFFGVESNFRVSNLSEVEKKSKNCRKLPKIQNLKLKMSKGKELAWNGWLIEWEIISSRLLEKINREEIELSPLRREWSKIFFVKKIFFITWFVENLILLKNSEFDTKTEKCIGFDVLLLSAFWLAVEFQIMISSNRDLFVLLSVRRLPAVHLPSNHQNGRSSDAPGFRSADINQVFSNLNPPYKSMNEKMPLPRAKT